MLFCICKWQTCWPTGRASPAPCAFAAFCWLNKGSHRTFCFPKVKPSPISKSLSENWKPFFLRIWPAIFKRFSMSWTWELLSLCRWPWGKFLPLQPVAELIEANTASLECRDWKQHTSASLRVQTWMLERFWNLQYWWTSWILLMAVRSACFASLRAFSCSKLFKTIEEYLFWVTYAESFTVTFWIHKHGHAADCSSSLSRFKRF